MRYRGRKVESEHDFERVWPAGEKTLTWMCVRCGRVWEERELWLELDFASSVPRITGKCLWQTPELLNSLVELEVVRGWQGR